VKKMQFILVMVPGLFARTVTIKQKRIGAIDEVQMMKTKDDEIVRLEASIDKLRGHASDVHLGKYAGGVLGKLTVNGHDAGQILIEQGLARPYSGGRRQPWCN